MLYNRDFWPVGWCSGSATGLVQLRDCEVASSMGSNPAAGVLLPHHGHAYMVELGHRSAWWVPELRAPAAAFSGNPHATGAA